MKSTRLAAVIGTAVIAAAGLATIAGCATTPKAPTATATPSGPAYSYYRSMMGRFAGGPMMGGTGYGPMTGTSGYAWMMGGIAAPAWMRGDALPGYMMGAGSARDPGKVMGALWAKGPGPRISPAQAARLGNVVPAGATLDSAANRITFGGANVRLAVLASPAGGPDETFASRAWSTRPSSSRRGLGSASSSSMPTPTPRMASLLPRAAARRHGCR